MRDWRDVAYALARLYRYAPGRVGQHVLWAANVAYNRWLGYRRARNWVEP